MTETSPPPQSVPYFPHPDRVAPIQHHFFYSTVAGILAAYNRNPSVPPEGMRRQLRLQLFICHEDRILLFSSRPRNILTVPSNLFHLDAPSLPRKDQIAWQVMRLLEPPLKQEKLVGLQFVDFAHETPLIEERADGQTLDLAIVVQVKACTLDDKWIGRQWPTFNGHVLVDPDALLTHFLRRDVSANLMQAVADRYREFRAEWIAKLPPRRLERLCLGTLDTMYFLRYWLLGEKTSWAAIGQVDKYPFEGLFIMPLSEVQYLDAAREGYTHWKHSNWEYTICGSSNMFHNLYGEEEGAPVIWLFDWGTLAQIFDGEGFMRVTVMKTPRKLRWESKDEDSKPLSRDRKGWIWRETFGSDSATGA